MSLEQTYSNEKQENENDATLERHLSYQRPFAVRLLLNCKDQPVTLCSCRAVGALASLDARPPSAPSRSMVFLPSSLALKVPRPPRTPPSPLRSPHRRSIDRKQILSGWCTILRCFRMLEDGEKRISNLNSSQSLRSSQLQDLLQRLDERDQTGSGRGGRAAVAQAGAQPWRYP